MSSHEERLDDDTLRWLKEQEDLLEQTWKETTKEVSKVSRPKMQKVSEYMAARVEFKTFYVPQLIAIGPFQCGYRYLNIRDRGTAYKCKWTAMYLKYTNQTFKDLYIRISSHEEKLCQLFNVDFSMSSWLGALIYDGCSVLQVLEKSNNFVDAEQELKISLDKLVQVHQDLLILDNQIPLQALRLLCNDEARLKECLQNFLEIHRIEPDRGKEKGNKGTHNGAEELKVIVDDQQSIEDDPVHLLDYLRWALLIRDLGQIHKEVKFKRKSLHLTKYKIGTIRELKAAGIRVKKDPHNTTFYPSFSDGILYLPELTADGSTALIFLNLIAYEMCPDFRNDFSITSYIVFMSSLIDQPEDCWVICSLVT